MAAAQKSGTAEGEGRPDQFGLTTPFIFESTSTPAQVLEAFRNFYGPTMNAFEAAANAGRADDLQRELKALFVTQNQSTNPSTTTIPATYLRVAVAVN